MATATRRLYEDGRASPQTTFEDAARLTDDRKRFEDASHPADDRRH